MMHGFTPGANCRSRRSADRGQSQQAFWASRSSSRPRPGAGGTTSGRCGRARRAGRHDAHRPSRRSRGVGCDLQAVVLQLGRGFSASSACSRIFRSSSSPIRIIRRRRSRDVIRTAQADEGKTHLRHRRQTAPGCISPSSCFVSMAKGQDPTTFPLSRLTPGHHRSPGPAHRLPDGTHRRCCCRSSRDGRLRPLGVYRTENASSPCPNVPTIAEQGRAGLLGDVVARASLAPAGLPAEFSSARSTRRSKAILADPSVTEKLRGFGSEAMPTTPAGFKARVAEDVAKWTKVVADANIPRV